LLGVDFEHAVHLRGHDHDRVVERCGAARETGSASPSDERPAVGAGDANRRRDIVGRVGPTHRERPANGCTGVTRVQREFEWFGARAVGTERRAQVREQGGIGMQSVRDRADRSE
jgi:hypothetical protein